MVHIETYGRAICVCVDAEGYSKRLDPDQADLQDQLVRAIDAAATAARLNRQLWDVQVEGDGQLIVAPLDDTEPRYVDDFVDHLNSELNRLNRGRVPEARLRLRVAVNVGVAYRGANGWVGDGVVLSKRLVNAKVVREALAASHGNLVLALSAEMYRDAVQADHTRLSTADFVSLAIDEDKILTTAYLWFGPEVRPHDVRLARLPATIQTREPGGQRGSVNNNAETQINVGDVHAQTVHFGTVVRRSGGDGDA